MIWLYFQHPPHCFLIGRFYNNNLFVLYFGYFLKNFLCFGMKLIFFLVSVKQQYFSTIPRHLQLPHFVLKINFGVKPIDIKMCHSPNLLILGKIVPFLGHFNFELSPLKLKTRFFFRMMQNIRLSYFKFIHLQKLCHFRFPHNNIAIIIRGRII